MQPTKILVVDDDPLMRAVTSAMLQAQGWQVFQAGSAEEATMLVKFCEQRRMRLTVVLLDMVLPGGMSGLEALKELRGLDPDVPVIATSGFFEDSAVSRCMAEGFKAVLPKPFSSNQLCEALARLST